MHLNILKNTSKKNTRTTKTFESKGSGVIKQQTSIQNFRIYNISIDIT